MKKLTKRNSLILMSSGMFIIATSQVFSRFVELTDLTKGLFLGIGLGLLILAVALRNYNTVQKIK
ncbi:hypothetical protein H4V97_000121 [Flavobacterium sp. CG_23.5]|uniref:hypothetical protein n=1 Tax=unclassified Flavobacterium TaxID=196869 RepID=UPI0018CBCB6E|nr:MULTISPECIES: hypothetical protein [unclassified Flavobacterium]MBG6110200.1 hypothetical protein [Flavobacterium sp. CG_9.10]MBP2281803.1 hypothetical protein [Flavobacterium sp. CG_23.5]